MALGTSSHLYGVAFRESFVGVCGRKEIAGFLRKSIEVKISVSIFSNCLRNGPRFGVTLMRVNGNLYGVRSDN